MRRADRLVALALAGLLAAAGPAGAVGAGTERELGRRFLLAARGGLPLVDDPAVTEYVRGVAGRLVATLGAQQFDYQFFVVEHPALNAFAVPGGYIFIFSGLLARVGSDDELAGVLAHEIGHVAGHHIVRLQSQGQAWNYAALLGALLTAVNPVLGAGAIAAAQTAQLSYSRDFEQEADFLGLRYASEAGYDPRSLGSFFKQLLAEQRVNPVGAPAYMLSHPLTEKRVTNVDTMISSQKLKTPAGRPAGAPELAEVQAVARAIADPVDVVVGRYRREVEQHPDSAEARFLLGRVYQTVGQLDAARVAFEECRARGGLGGRVDRPLGAVYVGLKQPDKAREALGRHLARHPNDAWTRLQLGKALAEVGDTAGALAEYQRALRLDPDLEEAQRLAGLALGRRGDEADGFYHLALASRLRGELDQSLNQFERSEVLLPADSPKRQEVAEAIEELRPLVRELEQERRERQRRGRRG